MKLILSTVYLFLALQAVAQTQTRQSFPITRHQVARALELQGLDVPDDQVTLVASIVADGTEPLLHVEAMQPLTRRDGDPHVHVKVRLDCAQPRSCIPFFAVVTLPVGMDAATLTAPLSAEPAKQVQAPPISMRAGTHATLRVDSAKMHISIPVISLQNGAVGALIHVISPDHKQTYYAMVVSSTLLSGRI